LGVLIEPMRSVGGDFYDFIPLGGDRLGIAIGDVSGHGVPAAIFMALAFSLLHAEAGRSGSPGEALRNLNCHLLDMSDSGMFVTILYGILDCATREFSYSRAGHELPLLLDARREEVELVCQPGQILGLFPDPLLDEQRLTLAPGSLLLIYTDGVNEAMDADGQQFGLERLRRVLQTSSQVDAQGICEAVYHAVRAHCGAAPPNDDVLLVALQAE
jgi:sigma-B regulation protein RsbU (phosphoserine phosphatase)